MFKMSWTTPYEGEIETVRLTCNPMKIVHPFGPLTDADGNTWDMGGMQGSKDGILLLLRPCSNNDPWHSTAGGVFPSGSRQWIPYKVEVVEEEEDV